MLNWIGWLDDRAATCHAIHTRSPPPQTAQQPKQPTRPHIHTYHTQHPHNHSKHLHIKNNTPISPPDNIHHTPPPIHRPTPSTPKHPNPRCCQSTPNSPLNTAQHHQHQSTQLLPIPNNQPTPSSPLNTAQHNPKHPTPSCCQSTPNSPPQHHPTPPPPQLLRYIRYAKSLQPQISEESRRKLITCYRCVVSCVLGLLAGLIACLRACWLDCLALLCDD